MTRGLKSSLMRIVSWNINGIRTLPLYHPWNTLKTFDDILNHLQADIVCFQEVKSARQVLPKQVSIPPSYDAFFSFPVKKTGYSGVVTYTRTNVVMPWKAEEGLTGLIQPRPALASEERISRWDVYPPNLEEYVSEEAEFKDLDGEGRAVLVDLGLFVLINVYCPNDAGSEEREKFKMDYHRLLETRVRTLIGEERQVMVVGDLNACASVEDHCEGQLMVERGLAEGLQGEEGFWGKDYRKWIRDWLVNDDGSGGCMVDIVRKFWPNRKKMYTCWNTKISARETNYGTRIDFILITPGLVPWIKAADIQPDAKGSDHCPVFVDLYDEITNSDGSTRKLRDLLRSLPPESGGVVEPPRLAAKYWEEHKQKLLSTFFVKKAGVIAASLPTSTSPPCTLSEQTSSSSVESTESQSLVIPEPCSHTIAESSEVLSGSKAKRKLAIDGGLPESPKRIKPSTQRPKVKTKGKRESGSSQSTIASFFSQPKPPLTSSSTLTSPKSAISSQSSSQHEKQMANHDRTPHAKERPEVHADDPTQDADYQLALLLSQSDSTSSTADKEVGKAESKQAWNTLLAPTQIPRCTIHGEFAKEFTVNKPGPNKGKKFFICSRPVGPGYDKGHSARLREQVDPRYRCGFFKWSNDARREMTKSNSNPSFPLE